MSKLRPLRPEWVTLLTSLLLLACYNLPLWRHLLEITPAGWSGRLLAGAFILLLGVCFNLILTLFAFRGVLKPVLSALLLLSAGVA